MGFTVRDFAECELFNQKEAKMSALRLLLPICLLVAHPKSAYLRV